MLGPRWPNAGLVVGHAGPELVQCWPGVGSMVARSWFNAGLVSDAGQEIWFNAGPEVSQLWPIVGLGVSQTTGSH